MNRVDVAFPSGGDTIRAWWYGAGEGRRPCIVMAHGAGGTKRCGLSPYADRFAGQGWHVLVIDYRHFGDSGGQPRQLLSPRRQVADTVTAARYARSRSDVDPQLVALWGSSLGGGNVLAAAVQDRRVAAVVSMCPLTDGAAGLLRSLTQPGMTARTWMRVAGLTAADGLAWAAARPPVLLPLVGPPGSAAVMTAPDCAPGFRRIAGPDFINGVAARLAVSGPVHRPIRAADRMPCPWLVQICLRDTVAPVSSARAAARRAGFRATVKEYDLGHFDTYVGEGYERAVRDQIQFLASALQAPLPAAPSGGSGASGRDRGRRPGGPPGRQAVDEPLHQQAPAPH